MPRRFTPDEIDYAERLYASGQSFDQVAAALGRKSADGIRHALQRRGVEARPAHAVMAGHNRIAPPADLKTVHASGESVLAMSKRYDVARGVVERWLRNAGLPIRSSSEAGVLRMGRMTAAERKQLASASHAARRGQIVSDEVQEKIAATRERIQYGGRTSPGTDVLCAMLHSDDISHVREKAVGRYNVDIALPESSVAVEVLGGNWHGAKPIHARRTPDILNRGWHILFVWDIKRCKVGPGAYNEIVAFAQFASENPSARREYRVIRGDGKLLAVGHADDDEFPLIPPSVSDLR